MARNINGWLKITKPTSSSCSPAVKIDCNHFIVATGKSKITLRKYNVKHRKWNVCKISDLKNIKELPKQLAYDSRSKCIYFIVEKEIIQINENENKIRRYPVEAFKYRRYQAGRPWSRYIRIDDSSFKGIIAANGKCHIMWTGDEYYHYILDDEQVTHTIFPFNFPHQECQLFYISHRKAVYLMGRPLSFHKYCDLTQKWNKIDVTLHLNGNNDFEEKLKGFSVAVTSNEKYVIIFTQRDIFVMDINLMSIYMSKQKMPFQANFNAVIMDYKTDTDLLVHGFVRNEMKMHRMNIPFALISLIGVWSLIEYAHIIAQNDFNDHYKINVDKILESEFE